MKALIISHMYPSSFNEVAGIFVRKQVKALMEKGMEIQVISPIPWTPFPVNHMRRKWKSLSQVPPQTVWEGIPVWYPRYIAFPRAWFFAGSGRRMYRGIRRLVKKIRREFPFDLIHAHVALPDGYAGVLLAREYNVPLIITIHGQDLQHTIHRGPDCVNALDFTFANASRVILVSSKLKQLAKEYFGDNKIRVIANGVDPKEICTTKIVGNLQKIPVLLSVSNLITTKGLDLNLMAVQHLRKKYPSIRYKIIGAGPLEDKLKNLADSLGIADSVNFLGALPHQEVMKYIAACDIFVLPSWNEGFGVVYLEAMAHGKPVIGCKGEGIEDFVEHGKTGLLVKPRDVDSLVEALDFLLSHPDEASVMGEQAHKLVLENYTWGQNAEKTIEVYKEALNEH